MQDPRAAMAEATRAFQSGDFATARTLASGLAALLPTNPMVLQLLGLAQTHGGDPANGLKTLERALALAPQDNQLRFNVANAMLSAGEARKALSIAAKLPSDPPALHLRALAAKAAGRRKEAHGYFTALIEKAPQDLMALNNFGNFLCDEERFEDALAVLGRACSIEPRSAQLGLNHGRALDGAGRHGEAIAEYRRAARLGPDDPDVLLELARAFIRHGEHAAALAPLREAERRGVRSAELFTLAGISELALQDREAAEQAFTRALAIAPDDPRALLNLGIMLEQANRVEDLRRFVERHGDTRNAKPEMDYLKALILRRDERFAEALDLARTVRTDALDDALLAEFIGKLHDRLGETDHAFAAFRRMNEATAAWPAARRIDPARRIGEIREQARGIDADWCAGFAEGPPQAQPSPAFLGGFLRSGTTLLDTILMGHPQTDVREEQTMIQRMERVSGGIRSLPGATHARIEAMRAAYFAEADRVQPRAAGKLLVDKNPLMTLSAATIHRAFPDAKFVFTLRHPCDVVLSCFMQNFHVSEDRAAFLDIAAAAAMYDAVMTQWERCREALPLDLHTIRYEDLVSDPEAELRPLIAFLGLEWDDALLEHRRTARERGHIRTPSYAQVTEQVYTRSRGRWEAYRRHLEPALDVLAPWAERFGYGPVSGGSSDSAIARA